MTGATGPGGELQASGSCLGTTGASRSVLMVAEGWFGLRFFWLGLTVPGVTDLLGRLINLRLLVVEGGDNIGVVVVFELKTLCIGDWITLSVLGTMNALLVDACWVGWITGWVGAELSKLVLCCAPWGVWGS